MIDYDIEVDFNQGLDIRLITNENAKLLHKLKTSNQNDLKFAFDNPNLEKIIIEKTKILRKNGIIRSRFFMLIGFNTTKEEDFRRLKLLDDLGHRIYLMPYNKKDTYQKAMRKYINRFYYRKMSFHKFINVYGSNQMRNELLKNKIIRESKETSMF